jgi:hypothetical protein
MLTEGVFVTTCLLMRESHIDGLCGLRQIAVSIARYEIQHAPIFNILKFLHYMLTCPQE